MNDHVSVSQLYDRVAKVLPKAEWLGFEGDVAAIIELKKAQCRHPCA